MKRKMFLLGLVLMMTVLISVVAFSLQGGSVAAQGPGPQSPQVTLGTGFTYQGQLKKNNAPVNDNTCSMTFSLWDSSSSGAQVGGIQTIVPVTVTNGLFTVVLNGGSQFGVSAFDGSDRWLQAAVQCAGDGSPVTLSRQRLSAAPYAFALPGLWVQRNATSPNIIGGFSANAIISTSYGSVIGGGGSAGSPNTIDGSHSVVAGGSRNTINGSDDSFIGGGFSNTVTAASHEGTIGGGGDNSVSGDHAAIFAGIGNTTYGDESFIGGGSNNVASGANSTIGGGSTNFANGQSAVIGGGSSNVITGTTSAANAVIGGGSSNVIRASSLGDFSTIAGGADNAIRGGDIRYNTISGGFGNVITGTLGYATIGGGNSNTVSAQGGTIPGGYGNEAGGAWSFAAGILAKAKHDQTFVWNDDVSVEFDSTASRQFLIHANGGVGIGTNAPATQLHVVKSANGSGTNPGDNVAVLENTNTNNSADVLALKIGGTANPATSNNFITFLLGNNTSAGSIQGNGLGGVELGGIGSDYAEWLPRLNAGEAIAPGEIVGVFDGRISKETRGTSQVMVVSTGPIVAGNDPGEQARDGYAQVAFIGQVMARVRGAVLAGDFIVPSGLGDGVGVAIAPETITAEQFAQVVGQAWEASADERGAKAVRIAVGLIRHDPSVQRLVERAQTQSKKIELLELQNAALDARLTTLEQNAQQHTPATLANTLNFSPTWFILAGMIFVGLMLARRFGFGGKP
jgi:hypothetical protein